MSELRKIQLSWGFIIVTILVGEVLFSDLSPVMASDDHEEVRQLQNEGKIISLSELIDQTPLKGMRVIEAELERENGRLVYEIEFLDPEGRVYEQYFDATTGQALSSPKED